jgi:endonuclease VIII
MPEGPSIVILKEELSKFKNKKVLEVKGNSKIDLPRLSQKKIIDIKSWGKHLLLCFDDFFIRVHLLMYGRCLIDERKEIAPRLSLTFKNGEVNFYSCSVRLEEGSVDDVYDWEVDTMSDHWNPKKAAKSIKLKKEEMICDIILDQEIFAGAGNIIKNEVLFIERVHPESITAKIPPRKLKQIIDSTRNYCFDFYRWKKNYELRKHYQIYTKVICPRCGIKRILKKTGFRERRSFFCTNCQIKYE